MKSRFATSLVAAASSLSLLLTLPATASPGDDIADKYFSKTNPTLTPQELRALDQAKRWLAHRMPDALDRGKSTVNISSPSSSAQVAVETPQSINLPTVGAGGVVWFPHGTVQPSIICAVLQICDVALQPGEKVNGLHLGDSARWSVEPAISGSGPNETLHLIIKPLDVGLETSLAVYTDRRSYHMRLRSHRSEYMPLVAFSYPEEAQAKWEALILREKKIEQARQDNTIPQTGEYLGNLDFNYSINGDATWKPTRVYNDGRKTIIEMPTSMSQTEAPTLLVLRKEGGLFSDDETVMVNYRIQNNRYIVDSVFEKAILVSGVGSTQNRVTVTRSK